MRLVVAGLASALLAVPAAAQGAPETASEMVEVRYKGGIERILSRVNRFEQMKEKRFRKACDTEHTDREDSVYQCWKTLSGGTPWANKTLIPKVENYTVTNLLHALTVDNLKRAVPNFDGKIVYEIDRFKVANHEVAILSGNSSYMIGRVTLMGPNGEVRKSEEVTANLVVDRSAHREHTEPKYPFLQLIPETRIAPTVSNFVEKALERLWPEKKDDIHGPAAVFLSGAGGGEPVVP